MNYANKRQQLTTNKWTKNVRIAQNSDDLEEDSLIQQVPYRERDRELGMSQDEQGRYRVLGGRKRDLRLET